MDKQKRGTGKVFKPNISHILGISIMVAMYAIIFVFLALVWSLGIAQCWIPFILLLFGLVFWNALIEATQTSLTVYEDGLEWQRGGARLFAEWDELYELGRKSGGRNAVFGIYLNHAIEPEVQGLIEKLVYGRATNFIRLTGIVVVPSYWAGFGKGQEIDSYQFAETEFGRNLLHYAPQLFATSTDYKPKHRLEDDIGSQETALYAKQKEDWSENHGKSKT